MEGQRFEDDGLMGFFKLPRELRDNVYDFYFACEGNEMNPYAEQYTPLAKDEIDLRDADQYVCKDITEVCKQLRHETLDLYQTAKEAFWDTHYFFVHIEAEGNGMAHEDIRSQILPRVMSLKSEPRPKRLCFRIAWGDHRGDNEELPSIILTTAYPTQGLQWGSYQSFPSTVGDGFVRDMLYDIRDHHSGFAPDDSHRNIAEMDVLKCMELVCKGIWEQLNLGARGRIQKQSREKEAMDKQAVNHREPHGEEASV